MIIDYDHNQNLNTDRKLDSLKESVQMALNENDAEHKGFRALLDKVNSTINSIQQSLTNMLQRLPYFYGYNVSNLNSIMHFGFGYTNSATGTPSGTGNGMVLAFPSDTENVVIYQFYIPYSNASIYKRIYSSGSWGNWVTNTNDGIVEEGTSGIWTYRKWSNGTAECWGYNTTYNHTYSAWGSIYSFDIPRIAFPTGLFISDPVCFAHARCTNGNSVSSPNSGEATSVFTCSLSVIRGTSTSTTHAVTHYYAIGKWK